MPRPALCSSRQYAAAQHVGREVTLEVHGDDGVPLGLGHVDDHTIAKDAGVVHQDVQVTEGLDGRVDEVLSAFPVGDVVGVGDRFAALRTISAATSSAGVWSLPSPSLAPPRSLTTTLAPSFREEQCVLATDAAPCTGDDRNASFERSHEWLLVDLMAGRLPATVMEP